MAIRLQELKKEFLGLLADALTPLGFKRRGEDFYRLQPYGKDIISVTFVSHPELDFKVKLDIGVRHDTVEEMVNAYCPDMPKNMVKWTDTIGNRLDNLTRQFTEWQWEISEEADLKREVRNLMETAIHGIALPYFQRFSSLEEVLCILSKWDEESHRKKMLLDIPATGMKAIAAAYILNKRDVFDDLLLRFIPSYEERAREDIDCEQGLPHFLALAEDLKKRWSERESGKDQ